MIAAVSHLPAFAVNPCSEEPDIRRNAIYLKYADSDQSCISVKAFDVWTEKLWYSSYLNHQKLCWIGSTYQRTWN